MVPICKYAPHGLISEIRAHPGHVEGYVECTDECDPREMTYAEFVDSVGEAKSPSMTFSRCAVCSCAKQK